MSNRDSLEEDRNQQILENAHWLMDQGMHIELVAKRLGLSLYALEKKLEREKKGGR